MSGIAKAYIVGRIKEITAKRWGKSEYLQVVIETDPVAETVCMVKVPEKQIAFWRKNLNSGCVVWIDGTYESLPGAQGGYYNQVVAWRTGKITGRRAGRKTGKQRPMPVSEMPDDDFVDDGMGFGNEEDVFDEEDEEDE